MPPSSSTSVDEALEIMRQAELLLSAADARDAALAAATSVPMEVEGAREAVIEATLGALFTVENLPFVESLVVGMEVAVAMQRDGPAADGGLVPQAASSSMTSIFDNGPLLKAIEQNVECVINGQRMTVHSYLLTVMADALAEVGVVGGELNMPKISIIEGKGVVERGAWADQVDSGVLIVAGASCPHGVIIYWACGPAKGLLAWCVMLKPSMGAAEILGLQFGDRVFIWGTDPVEPADFCKKFKQVQKASKVVTPKQMALGILLVHLHSHGCTWDGFIPLSKSVAGSLVRRVKASFFPDYDPGQVKTHDWDGKEGTWQLALGLCTETLASYLDRCPAPPFRVNITWRRSACGSDNFGFEVVQTDRSLGSVYLCVARYPIVAGAPEIPAAGSRDRFSRHRTQHRGMEIVSVIPGRGNRAMRLSYYEKQARAVGVEPHQLLWYHEFPKEELSFWETRLIDFLGEGGGLERKAWFGVGGDQSAPSGMKLESFFGYAGDDPEVILRFIGREKAAFERQFLDRSIHAFEIQIPP